MHATRPSLRATTVAIAAAALSALALLVPASTAGAQAGYLQGKGSFSEMVMFTGGKADLVFNAASTGSPGCATSSAHTLCTAKA